MSSETMPFELGLVGGPAKCRTEWDTLDPGDSRRAEMPCLAVGIASGGQPPGALAGGDFADAVPLDGGRVALVLGNVYGGDLAALCVPPILYALRLFVRDCPHPACALGRLNSHLCGAGLPLPVPLVALSLAVVDARTGETVCACAGSEPPLILRAGGGVETVGAGRTALGVDADRAYRVVDFRLGSGDALLLATDGITEAWRTSGAGSGDLLRYGELAGLAVAAFTAGGPPEQVARAVLDGARALPGAPQDDACVLVATRR